MHKLVRQVRFSINPFLDGDGEGFNSYASKPCGNGLAIFFELGVGLIGQANADTGFVVNVVDVDKQVREHVVEIFSQKIREYYRKGKHVGFSVLANLLEETNGRLKGKFGDAIVGELSLKLNPYRKLAVDCEDLKMIYFSEKFEFASMHKLWNTDFSEEKNFEVFGKCANPTGHGHNYSIEVTVKMDVETEFKVSEFERVVDDNFVEQVDHKNLNADVEYFSKNNPTVENLAVFAWGRLAEKFPQVKLHSVTIWETDKTYCTYYG
ncbi:MAG: hypothetical protein FVQ80_00180 [Planctomycetes bacterium]|nr:hypothetical protein [Planctomycetota bacterium]